MRELTVLAFLQNQWMPQKLIDGMLIKGNPLALHPGAHVSDSLFCRPGVSIKLHDYVRIELSHGWYELGPLPSSNLLLKLNIFLVPQLDLPLSEERLAINGLKPLLVPCTPEPVSIKVHICLWGRTGTLSSGIFPGSLGWELLWSHFLQGNICKVSLQEISIYHNKG